MNSVIARIMMANCPLFFNRLRGTPRPSEAHGHPSDPGGGPPAEPPGKREAAKDFGAKRKEKRLNCSVIPIGPAASFCLSAPREVCYAVYQC